VDFLTIPKNIGKCRKPTVDTVLSEYSDIYIDVAVNLNFPNHSCDTIGLHTYTFYITSQKSSPSFISLQYLVQWSLTISLPLPVSILYVDSIRRGDGRDPPGPDPAADLAPLLHLLPQLGPVPRTRHPSHLRHLLPQHQDLPGRQVAGHARPANSHNLACN
jgi:hypothetical protein